jgi:hypothetical protein
MGITKLTTNGVNGTKYDIASADNYYMEPIATTLLGSAATTITFSNIPQTYKHLQIRYLGQTNRGTYGIDNSKIQFNGDTGSNYSWHVLSGDGAGAFSGAGTSQTFIKSGDRDLGTTTVSNTFGAGVIDILDYANVYKYKTTRSLSGEDINGTVAGFGGGISLSSGLWMNTAAITSITFNVANGTQFTTYSRFSLYGVKA